MKDGSSIEKKRNNVKKNRIKPEYSKFGEDSFEYFVLNHEDIKEGLLKMTVYLPARVTESIKYLRRNYHSLLQTNTQTSRYLCRCGIKTIQQIPEIREIGKLSNKLYLQDANDQILFDYFNNNGYSHSLGLGRRKFCLLLPKWLVGNISEIALEIGMPAYKIALLCLVAGIAKSEQWIPRSHHKRAGQEIERFQKWLKQKVERIKGECESRQIGK